MSEHRVVLGESFRGGPSDRRAFTIRYASKKDYVQDAALSLAKSTSKTEPDEYVVQPASGSGPGFHGTATPAKEIECALVYDPESGVYELHPIGFTVRLAAPKEARPARRLGSSAGRDAAAAANASSRPTAVQRPAPKPLKMPPSPAVEVTALSDDDDFGDLATELADELGNLSTASLDAATARVIGTAGAPTSQRTSQVEDDGSSSEEE